MKKTFIPNQKPELLDQNSKKSKKGVLGSIKRQLSLLKKKSKTNDEAPKRQFTNSPNFELPRMTSTPVHPTCIDFSKSNSELQDLSPLYRTTALREAFHVMINILFLRGLYIKPFGFFRCFCLFH